jgi:hypothetical protein
VGPARQPHPLSPTSFSPSPIPRTSLCLSLDAARPRPPSPRPSPRLSRTRWPRRPDAGGLGAAPARARPGAGAAPARARGPCVGAASVRHRLGGPARPARRPLQCGQEGRRSARPTWCVAGVASAWPARSRCARSSGHGAVACPAWWLAAIERNARGLAPSPLPSPPLRACPACPSVWPPRLPSPPRCAPSGSCSAPNRRDRPKDHLRRTPSVVLVLMCAVENEKKKQSSYS